MSVTSKRCDVCNELTYTDSVYCSAQCQDEANRLYDEIANDNEMTIEDLEEMNDFLNKEDEEPYLDDYYSPYKREWLE